ncbi:hypothetical protein [Bacillus sp. OTU530]|uniref:hypothetical protein n=1 Tax=Bacillus sp. OTU530 TaxID=3043862 RepID=UPI00313EB0F4
MSDDIRIPPTSPSVGGGFGDKNRPTHGSKGKQDRGRYSGEVSEFEKFFSDYLEDKKKKKIEEDGYLDIGVLISTDIPLNETRHFRAYWICGDKREEVTNECKWDREIKQDLIVGEDNRVIGPSYYTCVDPTKTPGEYKGTRKGITDIKASYRGKTGSLRVRVVE